MKRTLRYGFTGPDVVELQNKLNLRPPTALALLIADGIFGQKTNTRVIEFQRNNQLEADGVVGPITWGALDAGSPAAPSSPIVAAPGSLASRIIDHAKAQIGTIDYGQRSPPSMEPRGWQHLGTIFEKGANRKFSDAELKATPNPQGKSWCGIFCVYCYQLAQQSVTWNINGTGPQGAIKKVEQWSLPRTQFEAGLKPGDIGAVADKSHHFIIVSINPATKAIESVDGNLSNGRIMKLNFHKLPEIVAYYKPL